VTVCARASLLGDVGRDVEIDAAAHAVRGRTLRGMRRHGPLGPLAGARRNAQTIAHSNSRDLQHVVDRLDVALDIRLDLVPRRRYLAHLQCACQGAEQSTADGADHVVQRGRYILLWLDPVALLDAPVDAEPDRLLEPFQIRIPQGTGYSLDPQSARVHYVSHYTSSSPHQSQPPTTFKQRRQQKAKRSARRS